MTAEKRHHLPTPAKPLKIASDQFNIKGPPIEFIKAIEDDLNTPKAITLLHMYAKDRPKDLYAGMALLGLIPGSAMSDPHELKTIPIDHVALPEWEWETERVAQ